MRPSGTADEEGVAAPDANSETQSTPRGPLLALFLLGGAVAIYGSLVPLRFEALESARVELRFDRILHPHGSSAMRTDVAINFALFLPLGFFGMGFLARGRTAARRVLRLSLLLAPLLFLLSVLIEVAQVWVPARVPSGIDILAQTAGALTGILLWIWLGAGVADWLRQGTRARRPPDLLDWLLGAWVVLLFLFSMLPLDVTFSPSALRDKYLQDRLRQIPFAHAHESIWRAAWEWGLDSLLMVPVGMLARRSGPGSRSWGAAVALGIAFVFAIEFFQIFIDSRVADATDLVTGAAGIFLGVAIGGRLARRAERPSACPCSGRLPWVAFLLYALALVFLFWAPFDFRLDPSWVKPRLARFFETPLSAAQADDPFRALSAILRKFLLFAPLGACAAWASAQLRPTLHRLALFFLLLLAAGLAVGIELGQLLLPDRTGLFGDALVAATGALAGAALGHFLLRRSAPQ